MVNMLNVIRVKKYLPSVFFTNPKDVNGQIFSEMIVLYELALLEKRGNGISIEDVIFGDNGLANIYNLTSVMVNEILDKLDDAGYIKVDRTAGLDMIYFIREIESTEVIEEYYRNY